MAAEFITKTKTKKGETITVTYRIDAEFTPKKAEEICAEFIENYCVAHNAIDWLLEKVNITSYTILRDKGKETECYETVECKNYPFPMLRKDFIDKFFPTLGGKKEPAESLKDKLNRKYGKK